MPLVPTPKNCDPSVKKAIQILTQKLGLKSVPIFASITLTDLLASRLVATDSGKVLESIADLTAWIIQSSANQVVVVDNGDGTLTLSLPQNIHLDATPEFAGLSIKDSSDNLIFYVDDDEMYFTASIVIPIEAGMPIGLALALTYASP